MIIAAPSLASRLHLTAWSELQNAFSITESVPDHRTLMLADRQPTILLCRGTDIPSLVHLGIADVGLTGFDAVVEWCTKSDAELEVRSLAPARLSFVCFASVPGRHVTRVYTEYEAITRRWLHKTLHFKNVEVVNVRGSSEGMISLDSHGAGVLLVTSGRTLATNGLSDMFPLLATDLCLVSRTSQTPETWGDVLVRDLPRLACAFT